MSTLSANYDRMGSNDVVANSDMALVLSTGGSGPKEVIRWDVDGRVFWNGREVETDDELRQMVRDIHQWMLRVRA